MATATGGLTEKDTAFLHDLAQQLRVDSIRCSTEAGSGHPTSSMSAADVMAVLLARHLVYDWKRPELPTNDHLIFSKGHASPLCYSLFKAAGAISDEELMTFRKFGSRLQGHPTPILPWVDVATGSLGQGLPIAVGVALAGKYLDELPFHVWTLCGDSEMAEGSIWEGIDKAGFYHLSNFTAIVDVNRLGQRGPTELSWDLDTYRHRVEAFGATAIVIDGHDLHEVDRALAEARAATERPTVILARTRKGRGVEEVEDREDWHGKALPEDLAERGITELGGPRHITVEGHLPAPGEPKGTGGDGTVTLPRYEIGGKTPTRKAYGDALLALAGRPGVVALDGEVSNSTHADEFAKAHPNRYFEMYIAEQALVAAAVGLGVRGYTAYASTFAAFFSRAYDFVRMAAVSEVDLRLVGSHAGVEIGQDGPSQMALEDLASLRALHGSTVLYPSDPNAAAKLTAAMADTSGIVFMRTTRGGYPGIYGPDEEFHVGGSKVVRQSNADQVTLIGAGVTLHESLKAADTLADEGIAVRVIDLYSVKPVDAETLRQASAATGGRFVVTEDHYPQGGLAAAIWEALSDDPPRIAHCAVRSVPTSGTAAELMEAAGISADHIVKAARSLIGSAKEGK
ncbi:MAG TPA: transketolase [Candidatus Dormibacteraeota bacterium]|jgi:transketolase|nr:transketolase [Candidatus Dormibacteraeota bacterium]